MADRVSSRAMRFFVIAMGFTVALFLLALLSGFEPDGYHSQIKPRSSHTRKLLAQAGASTDRMGEVCGKDDIVVNQGPTAPLPNGIPTYTVEVLNLCPSGCAMAHIHVACGWFSSTRMLNPRVFRRLQFGDCLLNDGLPLAAGHSLSFQYANSFHYPLSISSATCS